MIAIWGCCLTGHGGRAGNGCRRWTSVLPFQNRSRISEQVRQHLMISRSTSSADTGTSSTPERAGENSVVRDLPEDPGLTAMPGASPDCARDVRVVPCEVDPVLQFLSR